MIDIHAHILDGLDDGSRSFLESKKLLQKLSHLGITAIIATPHYISESRYMYDNTCKSVKLEYLKNALELENIPVDLYLGNEIFIDEKIIENIKNDNIAPLNGSRYLLIEFPVHQVMHDLTSILFGLRSKGYVPIIAHPERYEYFYQNTAIVKQILDMGCLLEGNLGNAVGKYGKEAKKFFRYLLKKKMYHFLATDVHHEDDIIFTDFQKMQKKIEKWTSKEYFHQLTFENPLKVIQNEKIIE